MKGCACGMIVGQTYLAPPSNPEVKKFVMFNPDLFHFPLLPPYYKGAIPWKDYTYQLLTKKLMTFTKKAENDYDVWTSRLKSNEQLQMLFKWRYLDQSRRTFLS